ncbi:MAG: hypothetical protein R3B95_20080 [Nitrospirales bacterium]|nr:hypothetical protein [Nitrospirales bacterium]
MSSKPDCTYLLLGLTGTGKTNFLVALDVVLDDQSDPNGLVHSELAEDRVYLQPLKEQWLRGEELGHTSRQQPPPPHQLIVKHPASDNTAGLHLPDLAGETFDTHFVTHSIPADFCNRLHNAAGILLFLHCDHRADHDVIEDPSLMRSTSLSEGAIDQARKNWELEDASPQVKLVDLLQFIIEIGTLHSPLPIAVIISAWDLVEKTSQGAASSELPNDPARFLSVNWPLLEQFLFSHPNVFRFRVFGISARGGGITPEEIQRLCTFDRPCERVILVDDTHRSNDITRPLRWLLGLLDRNYSDNA